MTNHDTDSTMRTHITHESAYPLDPQGNGPRALMCSCGYGVTAEYQLVTRSYDYDKMRRIMDQHLDDSAIAAADELSAQTGEDWMGGRPDWVKSKEEGSVEPLHIETPRFDYIERAEWRGLGPLTRWRLRRLRRNLARLREAGLKGSSRDELDP